MSSRKKNKPSRRNKKVSSTTAGDSWLRHPLVFILVATFAIKLVVLLQLHHHPLLQPEGEMDSAYYVQLARQVVSGDIFLGSEAFFVSPLYVYFLALIFFFFGSSLLAAKVGQILLGTAAVGLIYYTARDWFNPSAAWIAAILAAGTGLFTFYEVVLLQASVDPFLTALELFLICRALLHQRRADFLVAGLALGLHALNRPNVLIYAVVLILMIALVKRSATGLRQAGLLACGLALALAPVTLRNTLATGELILISSHGGLNFYIGNNAEADGTYQTVPGITASVAGQARDARKIAEESLGQPVSAGEVSRYFYQRSWDWMAHHPWDAAVLFVRKAGYLLNSTHLTLNYSYTYYSRDEPTLLRGLFIGPWILIPMGLVGLFLLPGQARREGYWGWAIFVPVYGLSVVAFFVSSRYRLPLLIPLCAGAGAALWFLARAAHEGRFRELLWPGIAAILLGIAVNWNLGLDDARWGEQTAMVLYSIEKDRGQEAQELLERLESSHPQPGALHFMVGKAYQTRSRYDDAARHFERALEIDVGQAEIQLSLGQALLHSGKPGQAIPHLRSAYDAEFLPDIAAFDLAQALAETGRREEALVFLETITLPADADAGEYLALGDLALELDRPDLAEGFFRHSVERMPGAAAGHEKLGVTLALLERYAEAIGALEEACRIDPSSVGSLFNLALVYGQVERLEEARAQLEQALRLQPDYDRARQLLDQLNRLH